jgi:PhnB protein
MKRSDGTVAHAEVEIGDSCVMLADENSEMKVWGPKHYGGSPVTLVVNVEDCDALYKQAMAAGATSVREPADQPYGDRMAGVKDPFGYTWYFSTHIKDMSKEELEKL